MNKKIKIKKMRVLTDKQREKMEAKELKVRQEEFLDTINKVTDLELFDIFCQVDQSDDWDGAFTQEQQWKADHAGVAMRARLQRYADDRDRENLQTSEGY